MEKGSRELESGKPKPIPHFKMLLEQGVLTPEIIEHKYEGAGTEEDPYRVSWIDHDPRNPFLFPAWKKWTFTMVMAISTLAVAFISSAFSGGIRQIVADFGASQEVATLGVSLFVLGFAVGPLIWAPLSELFGRQVLFVVTYFAVTAFNAGACGSQNIWTLIILRFFAGSFGSSPLTNAGGVIADMFESKQRGIAMTVFAAAPFMGPVLGPIVGGFVGETIGWRWVEGVMAIFTGVVWVAGSLIVPETYAPVLLRRRAEALSKATGKVYLSKIDVYNGKTTMGHAFKTSLSRPWILLVREPIVLMLSIYMAIVYGTLYMLFSAFPIVFQQYRGWSQGVGGLAFLGVMVGMLMAVGYAIYDNKRYIKAGEDDPSGFAPPEARLPPAIIGGIALPIGLIWFAWTDSPSIHWIVSIIAGAPFGFGMVLVFLAIMNYLIDSYVIFAASVLAANSVLRSLFGAIFPLFTSYMYRNLGIHWATMVPAFLALACTPFPFLFYRYGKAVRERCKFAAEAKKFMEDMRAPAASKEVSDDDDDAASASASVVRSEKSAEPVLKDADRPGSGREEEIERDNEAIDDSYDATEGGRFVGIRTEPRNAPPLSRVDSHVSEKGFYEASPFDIDRVNTRESFAFPRARSSSNRRDSGESSKSKPSQKSGVSQRKS